MSLSVADYLKYLENKYSHLSQSNDASLQVTDIEKQTEKQAHECLQTIERIILKRNESRILEDGQFGKWNKLLYLNVLNIRDTVPLEETMCYIKGALSTHKLDKITKSIENELDSNLRSKLEYRFYYTQKDTADRITINKEIRIEWQRLLIKVSRKNLIIYALNVQKSFIKC